ncbi:ABC transporter permease [Massilia antarctica]|uniref:ABC transporter permease n=1 Tax=Massilia antarctica TaxID=2765360 RepID=A0AA49A6F4_9BURK|nr:ABC transporter permease [Massilia antarctica]QPI47597.1 ABC transporter permease [Massilia antarctica]
MLTSTLMLALRSIRRNLLRSFLTILGIVIGVSAVITMVTLGKGATLAVQNQISGLGANLLMVRAGQRQGPGGAARAPQFKQADAQAILAQIGGVAAAAPEGRASVTVVGNGRNWATSVTGSSNAWFAIGNWNIAHGRLFEDEEQGAGAAVCIIGETVRREIFGGKAGLGEQLRIKQFSCDVIGVLASKGQGAMGNDQDDTVVLPLRTLQRRVTGSLKVATLLVSMEEGSDSARLKASLRQLLRERRQRADGDDDNFNILDTQQLADTLSGTTRVMTTLLGAVAAVSLLVGGIGIMNIMLVSVTERTREIGLRLAIGALENEVLLQFLIEAVVLATLGGLVGIVIAGGASYGLASVMGVPYAFDPAINLLSFLFSAAIGVLFGYFPARRAAQMDPIEALRHE